MNLEETARKRKEKLEALKKGQVPISSASSAAALTLTGGKRKDRDLSAEEGSGLVQDEGEDCGVENVGNVQQQQQQQQQQQLVTLKTVEKSAVEIQEEIERTQEEQLKEEVVLIHIF
jgi:hypothetical protein